MSCRQGSNVGVGHYRSPGTANRSAGLGDVVVGPQSTSSYSMVRHSRSTSRHPARLLAVDADRNFVVGEHTGESSAGELRTLVRVEDVGGRAGQRVLECLDANAASMVIDSRQDSTRRLNLETTARETKPRAIGM